MSWFEAVAVHQVGKVGSASLFWSLERLQRWPCFHTHTLNPAKLSRTAPGRHIASARELRAQFLDRGRPVAVITMIREPIGRNVSAFFENLGRFVDPEFYTDPDSLYAVFRRRYPHNWPQDWLEVEFNERFGVDIFDRPFPSQGFDILDAPPHRILVLKTALSDDVKARVVADYLGLDSYVFERDHTTPRSTVHEAFRQRIDADYVEQMLGLPMAHHFFSKAERTAIRERWIAPPPMHAP